MQKTRAHRVRRVMVHGVRGYVYSDGSTRNTHGAVVKNSPKLMSASKLAMRFLAFMTERSKHK